MTQFRKYLMASPMTLALALTACGGGGGGGGVASTPPPPPPPPAMTSPPIVPVATSQEFATKGASYTTPSASYDEFTVSARHWPTMRSSTCATMPLRRDMNPASRRLRVAIYLARGGLPRQPKPVLLPQLRARLCRSLRSPLELAIFRPAGVVHRQHLRLFRDRDRDFAGKRSDHGQRFLQRLDLAHRPSFDTIPGKPCGNLALVTGSINLSFDFGGGTLSGKIQPRYLPRRALFRGHAQLHQYRLFQRQHDLHGRVRHGTGRAEQLLGKVHRTQCPGADRQLRVPLRVARGRHDPTGRRRIRRTKALRLTCCPVACSSPAWSPPRWPGRRPLRT